MSIMLSVLLLLTQCLLQYSKATCPAGWLPPNCTRTCNRGYYGINCASHCPGTCSRNLCRPQNGDCLQCLIGHTGPKCTKRCPEGLHGANCLLKCPGNCLRNRCDPFSGFCYECEPYFKGSRCQVNTWNISKNSNNKAGNSQTLSTDDPNADNNTLLFISILLLALSLPACGVSAWLYHVRKKARKADEALTPDPEAPVYHEREKHKTPKVGRVYNPIKIPRRKANKYNEVVDENTGEVKSKRKRKFPPSGLSPMRKKRYESDTSDYTNMDGENTSKKATFNTSPNNRRARSSRFGRFGSLKSPHFSRLLKENSPLRVSDAANYSEDLYFKHSSPSAAATTPESEVHQDYNRKRSSTEFTKDSQIPKESNRHERDNVLTSPGAVLGSDKVEYSVVESDHRERHDGGKCERNEETITRNSQTTQTDNFSSSSALHQTIAREHARSKARRYWQKLLQLSKEYKEMISTQLRTTKLWLPSDNTEARPDTHNTRNAANFYVAETDRSKVYGDTTQPLSPTKIKHCRDETRAHLLDSLKLGRLIGRAVSSLGLRKSDERKTFTDILVEQGQSLESDTGPSTHPGAGSQEETVKGNSVYENFSSTNLPMSSNDVVFELSDDNRLNVLQVSVSGIDDLNRCRDYEVVESRLSDGSKEPECQVTQKYHEDKQPVLQSGSQSMMAITDDHLNNETQKCDLRNLQTTSYGVDTTSTDSVYESCREYIFDTNNQKRENSSQTVTPWSQLFHNLTLPGIELDNALTQIYLEDSGTAVTNLSPKYYTNNFISNNVHVHHSPIVNEEEQIHQYHRRSHVACKRISSSYPRQYSSLPCLPSSQQRLPSFVKRMRENSLLEQCLSFDPFQRLTLVPIFSIRNTLPPQLPIYHPRRVDIFSHISYAIPKKKTKKPGLIFRHPQHGQCVSSKQSQTKSARSREKITTKITSTNLQNQIDKKKPRPEMHQGRQTCSVSPSTVLCPSDKTHSESQKRSYPYKKATEESVSVSSQKEKSSIKLDESSRTKSELLYGRCVSFPSTTASIADLKTDSDSHGHSVSDILTTSATAQTNQFPESSSQLTQFGVDDIGKETQSEENITNVSNAHICGEGNTQSSSLAWDVSTSGKYQETFKASLPSLDSVETLHTREMNSQQQSPPRVKFYDDSFHGSDVKGISEELFEYPGVGHDWQMLSNVAFPAKDGQNDMLSFMNKTFHLEPSYSLSNFQFQPLLTGSHYEEECWSSDISTTACLDPVADFDRMRCPKTNQSFTDTEVTDGRNRGTQSSESVNKKSSLLPTLSQDTLTSHTTTQKETTPTICNDDTCISTAEICLDNVQIRQKSRESSRLQHFNEIKESSDIFSFSDTLSVRGPASSLSDTRSVRGQSISLSDTFSVRASPVPLSKEKSNSQQVSNVATTQHSASQEMHYRPSGDRTVTWKDNKTTDVSSLQIPKTTCGHHRMSRDLLGHRGTQHIPTGRYGCDYDQLQLTQQKDSRRGVTVIRTESSTEAEATGSESSVHTSLMSIASDVIFPEGQELTPGAETFSVSGDQTQSYGACNTYPIPSLLENCIKTEDDIDIVSSEDNEMTKSKVSNDKDYDGETYTAVCSPERDDNDPEDTLQHSSTDSTISMTTSLHCPPSTSEDGCKTKTSEFHSLLDDDSECFYDALENLGSQTSSLYKTVKRRKEGTRTLPSERTSSTGTRLLDLSRGPELPSRRQSGKETKSRSVNLIFAEGSLMTAPHAEGHRQHKKSKEQDQEKAESRHSGSKIAFRFAPKESVHSRKSSHQTQTSETDREMVIKMKEHIKRSHLPAKSCSEEHKTSLQSQRSKDSQSKKETTYSHSMDSDHETHPLPETSRGSQAGDKHSHRRNVMKSESELCPEPSSSKDVFCSIQDSVETTTPSLAFHSPTLSPRIKRSRKKVNP